jgi:negative regulator of sigma E activity
MLISSPSPESEDTMDIQPQPAIPGADPSRMDARKLVRVRLAAKRRRAWRIRRTVTAFTVAIFVALFATIYVQLASGHDPALSTSSKTVVTAKKTTAGKEAAASTNSSSSNSEGTGSSEASSKTSSTPATVTTRQS